MLLRSPEVRSSGAPATVVAFNDRLVEATAAVLSRMLAEIIMRGVTDASEQSLLERSDVSGEVKEVQSKAEQARIRMAGRSE